MVEGKKQPCSEVNVNNDPHTIDYLDNVPRIGNSSYEEHIHIQYYYKKINKNGQQIMLFHILSTNIY